MGKNKTYILGISCFYHDSAAALICDGKILAAAQEERFSRIKHDQSFPKEAISFCFRFAGISKDDLSLVVFYEKPFIKFHRLLDTYLKYAPCGIKSFLKSMPLWIKEKIFLKDILDKNLQVKCPVIFCGHHESHAASAFYPSPFEKSAILTVDGVGEWTTVSFGVGLGNDIRMMYELKFPHSLGLLYSAFTYYLGFKVNSGEYKVMGLAPYGEPKYYDLIMNNLIDLKDDGSFRLNMRFFNYCTGLTMTNKKFNKLFGSNPRKSNEKIEQRHMDLAASVQKVTEEVISNMANHVKNVIKEDNLCLAGGVALNCVANGKILREGKFKNIWVQPAATDSGGALGAALVGWYKYLKKERVVGDAGKDSQKGSYLGPEFSDDEIENFLKEKSIVYQKYDNSMLIEKTVEAIINGNVIGWFQNRMEFGPRALGARSIIADPRRLDMQSKLNLKIKFRESFRPFAPSVLLDHAKDFFDINNQSPYMLFVYPVSDKKRHDIVIEDEKLQGIERLKLKRSDVPAITHLDYSARVQTVSREDNFIYYDLIKSFYDKTNCPLIINTSFNVRGEPICCSPNDAYNCFIRTEMDYLVMGSFIIKKTEQKNIEEIKKKLIEFELD